MSEFRKRFDIPFKITMQILLAKHGYKVVANVEIILKLRYPDLVIFDHNPGLTVHPLELGGKLSVIEFKSEKDPVSSQDITLFLLKTLAVLHQYGTSKTTVKATKKPETEFHEISGFLFLAESKSFQKLDLEHLQLTELAPGVWQLRRFSFAYIIDLQMLEVKEENELFLLFAGSKHREKLIEHSLKEYHTSPKAKLIIAVALLIDKDKVIQMAKVANIEVEPESYWKSVKEVIGQKATEEIMSDIEEIYGLKGILEKFDKKELIQEMGEDEVIETIGKDKVIQTIGKDEIIQTIGEKEIMRKLDFKTLEKYVKEKKKKQTINNNS